MSNLPIGDFVNYEFQFQRYYDFLKTGRTPDVSYFKLMEKANTEVDFERPELQEVMVKYLLIRDCLLGEANIKARGDVYLPRPNDKITPEQELRYARYVRRATFLNATGLTQRTIVGKLFSKPPSIMLPPQLELLRKNSNGEGLSINQLVEHVLAETFAFGRCGIYADFKTLDEPATASMADVEDLAPTLNFVRAENIVNWRIDRYRKKVTMVVVREYYEVYEGFSVNRFPQYRVFSLDDMDMLTVRVYRPKNPTQEFYQQSLGHRFVITETYQPRMADGSRWMTIPFSVIGSTDNDWAIDEPPLYQIATYDVSLYRNTADLEEAAFYVGQPTPYVAGIDTTWAKEMKIQDVKMGSGAFIPLQNPQSRVGLVQPSPDTMLDKIIDYKMSIMRHLGATVFSTEKLAEDQTATGAIYQALQIHAPLVTTSRNVVEALEKVLGFAAMYVGVDPDSDEIEVKLNSDILDNPLGVTGLQVTLELYKNGLITFEEAREQARVQGLVIHSPEEAREMIEANPPMDMTKPQVTDEVETPQNDNTTNFQEEMNDAN